MLAGYNRKRKGVTEAMKTGGSLATVRRMPLDSMTHINLGGIRYLPLAPAEKLRRAVREFQDVRPAVRSEALAHLTTQRSVVLCQKDWRNVLNAASGAVSDQRLSAESRDTFACVLRVLDGAIPRRAASATLTAC